jgi:hypothetical protein
VRAIQNKIYFIFIAEPHPILFKDSEKREQYKIKLALFLLPNRILSYQKITRHLNKRRKENNENVFKKAKTRKPLIRHRKQAD